MGHGTWDRGGRGEEIVSGLIHYMIWGVLAASGCSTGRPPLRLIITIITTQGNEGVDIKEGSCNNIVEDNYCTGQKDPDSACETHS